MFLTKKELKNLESIKEKRRKEILDIFGKGFKNGLFSTKHDKGRWSNASATSVSFTEANFYSALNFYLLFYPDCDEYLLLTPHTLKKESQIVLSALKLNMMFKREVEEFINNAPWWIEKKLKKELKEKIFKSWNKGYVVNIKDFDYLTNYYDKYLERYSQTAWYLIKIRDYNSFEELKKGAFGSKGDGTAYTQ